MILIILTVVLAYLIWRFGTRNLDYWKKKGVKHEEPVFFFGNTYKRFMQIACLSDLLAEWHKKFPEEQYVGLHMANNLALLIRDPELIKNVMGTDFRYFHQRGIHPHKHVREPLFQNLFAADGDVWKLMRQRLTPTFSSGKLKAMFPLIEKTAEKMLSVIEPGSQDVRDLMARYATDFIGTCGFGLNMNSLNDDSSRFRYLGKRIFAVTNRDAIVQVLKRIAPELFKHINFFVDEIERNTLGIIKEILEKRNYEPSGRNDFLDLLLELKKKGKITGQSIEHFNPDGTGKLVELELDDQMIAAQVFMFFAAGFETSSSSGSFLLHELAFNPEIQEQCQREVDEVLSRHGGKISYEAVKEMKYLEMAFKETIRLYPSPGYLMRKCGNKYTIPGTEVTIDEDIMIFVSIQALHRDPQYFEEPDSFNPDRFRPENIDNIPKFVYMPFGEGPRSCIGARLGVLQALAGVCAILSKFSVKPAPTSRRHPLNDPRSHIVQNIIGGIPLIVEPRTLTTP